MQNIEVQASRCYTVRIAAGALSRAGACVREVTKAETAVVVTDDIVNALYGDRVMGSLQAEGFRTLRFVFPNGEASKNLTVLRDLLEFLAENHVTRSDCIVALGGGVVGDLAGFAAATYQRGMGFAQIPTTLLAMVDSSVGGKTAIDLAAGKNLAGAFLQPGSPARTVPSARARVSSCPKVRLPEASEKATLSGTRAAVRSRYSAAFVIGMSASSFNSAAHTFENFTTYARKCKGGTRRAFFRPRRLSPGCFHGKITKNTGGQTYV